MFFPKKMFLQRTLKQLLQTGEASTALQERVSITIKRLFIVRDSCSGVVVKLKSYKKLT